MSSLALLGRFRLEGIGRGVVFGERIVPLFAEGAGSRNFGHFKVVFEDWEVN